MVAFDARLLILAFDEKAADNHPTPRLKERVDLLLDDLQKARTKILVPTQALSEFLAKSDTKRLDLINDSPALRIAPFYQRAVVEAAEMTRNAIKGGDKTDPVVGATWAKIKFDRQ
jgi:hypothetical protein